jgi:hypothetical protein
MVSGKGRKVSGGEGSLRVGWDAQLSGAKHIEMKAVLSALHGADLAEAVPEVPDTVSGT